MKKQNPLDQTASLEGVIEHRGVLGSVVRNLGIRIVSGEWSVGDTISKETELASELGVGRSVIRETFRILGAKGLIRSRTSDGTRVQPRDRWRLLDPDIMDWRIKSGDTRNLLQDLLIVRLVLEPAIAYTATLNADENDRERFEKTWASIVRTFEDTSIPAKERRQMFIETDLQFHRELLVNVKSELLDQLFSVIEAAMELLIDLEMRAKGYDIEMIGMNESHDLHQNVYKAFMAGDASSAEIAMRKLIEGAIKDANDGFRLLEDETLISNV